MNSTFKDFKFKNFINESLENLNFRKPTNIQKAVIPLILDNKDVIVQSPTGSGKTHSFLFPIFQDLIFNKSLQTIIVVPSRELAYQIYHDAKKISIFSKNEIIIHNYIGGTDENNQILKLNHIQPNIAIGTPGRILDLIRRSALRVSNVRQLVIDEADMALDMGFLDDMDKIASSLSLDLQMMVFSATIPEKLKPFLNKYMHNPILKILENDAVINDTISNWLLSSKGNDHNKLIYNLLTIINPYLSLIFTNTKKRADELTFYLRNHNLRVAKIHGGLYPRERKKIMKEIKNAKYQYVVTTDLTARGIDIKGVSHVINDGIPNNLEFFIHRLGRTGRIGMHGIAITIYDPDENFKINEIEKAGIVFQEKKIINQEIADNYDRNRRNKRKKKLTNIDPILYGMINKKKKNHKPGYKKKIKKAILLNQKKNHRIQMRKKYSRRNIDN